MTISLLSFKLIKNDFIESFLHFLIYHQTENREFIKNKIHKTRILPRVGNMTLLPNPGKPGFYGVGLPGRVISCQPCLLLRFLQMGHPVGHPVNSEPK